MLVNLPVCKLPNSFVHGVCFAKQISQNELKVRSLTVQLSRSRRFFLASQELLSREAHLLSYHMICFVSRTFFWNLLVQPNQRKINALTWSTDRPIVQSTFII